MLNENKQNIFKLPVISLTGILFILSGLFILYSGMVDNAILGLFSAYFNKAVASHWYDLLKFTGVELLYMGVIILISWFCFNKIFKKKSDFKENKWYLMFLGLFLIVVLWLPVIICGRNAVIDGVRYWWLHDDAMISMRYALNFSQGYGLVWNPGEMVEGYTNFLWTIYMSLVHFLGVPLSLTSLIIMITNIIISIITVYFIIRLVGLLDGGLFAGIASIVCFVLNGDILIWATNGHEMTILSLLIVISACRIIEESKNKKNTLLTYFIIALISLVRADALLLSILLYVLSFIINHDKKQVVKFVLISIIIPLSYIAFRYLYYGDLLPNTAYLKVTNWDNRINAGLSYTLSFYISYILMFIAIIAGIIYAYNPLKTYMFLLVLIYSAYITYVGGDAFDHFRFYVPVLPFIFILAFIAVEKIKITENAKILLVSICVFSSPISFWGYIYNYIYSADYYKVNLRNLEIAVFLKNNVPSESRVADFFAGTVFYFSGVKGVDLLGKSDKHIARMKVVKSSNIPGHNKRDFNYSIGTLKPDFVVSCLEPLQLNTHHLAENGVDYGYNLNYNSFYAEHCLPYPINENLWRPVRVCDWSSQFKIWIHDDPE